MSGPNWAKLVMQGRAKDVGVPWNKDEAHAVFELGIPADYVRRGCLTVEELENLKKEDEQVEKKEGRKPLEAMDRGELVAAASELGVEFTNDATDQGLRALIQVNDKPKKAAKEPKAEKKPAKAKK